MNDTSTHGLTLRLWRDYVRQHGRGILLALLCTLGVSGATALYPIVIQQAFDLFTAGDQRVLWLIPGVIILVTSLKALAQFGQAVAIQSVVLRVVEN
ncbi:MAG: ABC transporter permease, partial [Alphaproteobacteria bacterium]